MANILLHTNDYLTSVINEVSIAYVPSLCGWVGSFMQPTRRYGYFKSNKQELKRGMERDTEG